MPEKAVIVAFWWSKCVRKLHGGCLSFGHNVPEKAVIVAFWWSKCVRKLHGGFLSFGHNVPEKALIMAFWWSKYTLPKKLRTAISQACKRNILKIEKVQFSNFSLTCL